MKYNTQKNSLWENNIMTEGIDQYGKKWKDRLKDYGCFLTALANIEQERSEIELLPSKLNELVKSHNGYFWLAKDKNNKINYFGKIIEVSEKNASFLYIPVLEKILLFGPNRLVEIPEYEHKSFVKKVLCNRQISLCDRGGKYEAQ